MTISVSISSEIDERIINLMCHDVIFDAQDVKWDHHSGSVTILLAWPTPRRWFQHIVARSTESITVAMVISHVLEYSAHLADVEDWIKDVSYRVDSDGACLTVEAVKGSILRIRVSELDISFRSA